MNDEDVVEELEEVPQLTPDTDSDDQVIAEESIPVDTMDADPEVEGMEGLVE